MREASIRKVAHRVAALLTDGRPRGCKCRPSSRPGSLPVDNKHTSSPSCPLTVAVPDEVAELRRRVDDLALAISVLAPPQPGTGAHGAGPS